MPEIATLQSGWSQTVGSNPASTRGTTITASGSTNTKGSWVELVAATARDATWVMVFLFNTSSGNGHMVDIGIGSSTEQVVIPDLYCGPRGAGGDQGAYLFPVFIPAGSRLAARTQSNGASATIDVTLILLSGTLLAGGAEPSVVSAYGKAAGTLPTNIDPGASANTDSAWTQLTAATDQAHNWLCVSGLFGDGNLAAATRWLVDLGIGSATEQEIVADLSSSADTTSDMTRTSVMCFPYSVPAASRLVARARSNVTTDADRDVYLMVYGC